MSKKLLNEAQVRRFMGLAGLKPINTETVIKEMYGKAMEKEDELEEGMHADKDEEMHKEGMHADKDEEMHKEGMHADKDEEMHKEGVHADKEEGMYGDKEETYMKEMAHPNEEDEDGPMADEPAGGDADVELEEDDISALVDAIEAAMPVIDKLKGAMGGAAPEAPELDAEPPVGDGDELDMDMDEEENLAEVELELNEEEIVQEVARRVAKRILKAKKAHQQLQEALGK